MVATPAGEAGQGGIARQMQAVRTALADQTDVHTTFGVTRGQGSILVSPLHMVRFLAAMVAERLAGRLDVVHLNVASHGSTWRKLVIAAMARLLGVPYVVHLHGAAYFSFWSEAHPQRSRLIAWLFGHAARIVVLGEYWRGFVAGKLPGQVARIAILPNATPVPALEHRGDGETVHILFLGRIEARKGVVELGEALRNMANLAGWRATVAGDGAVEEARTQVAQWGLADRIAVPGWVGGETVAELIASADILVLPSYEENLPVAVIEGMASGLAVVATPVGAVPDIIHDGETGLLVPPKDAPALAAALTRLVGDAALRARLGAAAKALHRERLEMGRYVEALLQLWRDAAKR